MTFSQPILDATGTPMVALASPTPPGLQGTGPAGPGISVAVVSRYPSVRAGLRVLLESEPDVSAVAEAASLAMLEAPSLRRVDAVVVDLSDAHELDELVDAPDAQTGLVLLGVDAEAIRGLVRLLPRPLAWLRRDADRAELIAAVQAVKAGLITLDPALAAELATGDPVRVAPPIDAPIEELTPRELEVLRLLVEGIPNKTIALRLGISDHTVKFHVGSVLSKLGAASRTEAVRLAARYGLVAL